MKTQIYNINGEKTGSIELPSVFSAEVRVDLIAKAIESKKFKQPHGPAPMAGRHHSASGIIQHRRHVWKSGYGKGQSRTPRKVMSNTGTQFNLVGAEVPHTRGGRRAHPPKVEKMINHAKVNKKELQKALASAIASTANEKYIIKKYSSLRDKKLNLNLPFVIESKFAELKAKEFIKSIEKVLGKDLFEIAVKKKSIRSGKGKMRGRAYKISAGVLIVTGEKEKLKTQNFDSVDVKSMSIVDLADGNSPGRLTLYTEEAIKELKNKFDGENKK